MSFRSTSLCAYELGVACDVNQLQLGTNQALAALVMSMCQQQMLTPVRSSGERSCTTNTVANKRFPQHMLRFYESHLK
jgi:hypothetical protein